MSAVGLTVTDDALVVEGLGIQIVECGASGYQRVGDGLAGRLADSQLDAGWVDALLLGKVLAGVEGTFGAGARLLLRIGVADDDQSRITLLIECESDVVEAALGFVIDTNWATQVAREAEAAERLGLRNDRDRRCGDDDFGGRLGALAEVVDSIAGDRDRAWTEACRNESGGWSGAGNHSSGRGVGVGQRTILRTGADGADGNVGTGDCCAGVGAAGDGGRLKRLYGKGGSAGSLLARLGTFLDVAGGDIVSGSEVGGIDRSLGASTYYFAAVGSPGVYRGFPGVGMQRVRGHLDRISRKHAGGLSAAAEHDGVRRFDVAEASNEAA